MERFTPLPDGTTRINAALPPDWKAQAERGERLAGMLAMEEWWALDNRSGQPRAEQAKAIANEILAAKAKREGG
jgi:hypothetical protein